MGLFGNKNQETESKISSIDLDRLYMEKAKLEIEKSKLRIESSKLMIDAEKLSIEKEKIKIEREKIIEDEYFKASTITNQYALTALRTVLITNGAAAIGILTFISNVSKNGNASPPPYSAIDGAVFFGSGVFMATISTVLAYYSRAVRKTKRRTVKSLALEVLSGLTGVLSMFAFPAGVIVVAVSLGAKIKIF